MSKLLLLAGGRARPLFHAPLTSDLVSLTGTGAATFTRATAATYKTSGNLVASVTSGNPRFETGGILIEPQRMNVITRSKELNVNGSGSPWSNNSATVSADAATAPDGTATADKIVENTSATTSHGIFQAATVTANKNIALSVFFKKGERTRAYLQCYDGSADWFAAWFDLDAGTVGSQLTNGTGAVVSKSIEAFADGWYRCMVVGSLDATSTTAQLRTGPAAVDGQFNYTGDGSSGIYAWGAQMESNSDFVSSYIPTTTATVTRNADQITFPQSGNILAAQGTVAMTFTPLYAAQGMVLIDTRDASLQQGVSLQMDSGADPHFISSTTTDQADIQDTTNDLVAGTARKLAGSWALNDFALYNAGVAAGTDTSGAVPTGHTIIRIGEDGASANGAAGHIKNVRAYGKILTPAQIAAIAA